jgi:hypothetical protein
MQSEQEVFQPSQCKGELVFTVLGTVPSFSFTQKSPARQAGFGFFIFPAKGDDIVPNCHDILVKNARCGLYRALSVQVGKASFSKIKSADVFFHNFGMNENLFNYAVIQCILLGLKIEFLPPDSMFVSTESKPAGKPFRLQYLKYHKPGRIQRYPFLFF